MNENNFIEGTTTCTPSTNKEPDKIENHVQAVRL